MTSKDKPVAKDVRSAVQLEQELQIAYAQKCVAVLDVYSSEWGSCKAISETFSRLKLEAGDDLRFFTVDCNSVLDSLKQPNDDTTKRSQRPKNIDAIRDTLPEVWQPVLEERRGKSEPYFLFYKEGKKVNAVQGVNTPLIRSIVKDLCTVKTPASEFITNSRLQEIWDENFNSEESEVPADKFIKAVTALCKLTVPLTDEEKTILFDAIGAPKADGKQRIIHAEGLQKWFGDDEGRTFQQAFTDTLPDYENRATQVRLEREAEEKRKAEEEEKKRAEEEKKAQEQKAAEDAEKQKQQDAAAAENAPKSPEEEARELDNEIAALESKLGAAVLEAPEWNSVSDADLDQASSVVSSPPEAARATSSRVTAEALDVAAGAAGQTLAVLRSSTENGFLKAYSNVLPLRAAKAREALHTRTSSVDKLGLAKLAAATLGFSASEGQSVFGAPTDDFSVLAKEANLRDETITKKIGAAFAAAVACLAVAPSSDLFLVGVEAAADAVVTIDPLVALFSEVPEGSSGIKVTGLKQVLDQRPYSRFSDSFVYNAWFSSGKVTQVEGGALEIAITDVPAEDDFMNYCASLTAVVRDEDTLCRDILALRSKRARRATLPQPKPASKPATPSEEKKPSEEEAKPASRGSDKPATPAEERPKSGDSKAQPAEAAAEKPASRGSDKGEPRPASAEKPPAEERPKSAPKEAEKPAEERPASAPKEAAPAEAERPKSAPKEAEKPAEERPQSAPKEAEKPAEERPQSAPKEAAAPAPAPEAEAKSERPPSAEKAPAEERPASAPKAEEGAAAPAQKPPTPQQSEKPKSAGSDKGGEIPPKPATPPSGSDSAAPAPAPAPAEEAKPQPAQEAQPEAAPAAAPAPAPAEEKKEGEGDNPAWL